MSYTIAALAAVAVAAVVDLGVLRTRLLISGTFWATYPIIFAFQLASNGILTGRGVVNYDPDRITGIRLVHAPVEDLLFGFSLVLFTLSLWAWLGRRPASPSP